MKRKALLLDRDGVINVDHGYVGTPDKFEFMPGIFELLSAAQDMGYRLAILTNQSGVARGLYTTEDYRKVTDWMLKEMATRGIAIDLVLESFEHVGGNVAPYNRASFWRKPNPGMVLEAIQRLNLEPKRSVFIGDNLRDMTAALTGGVKNCIHITTKEAPEWTRQVKDLAGALAAFKEMAAAN